MKRAHLAEVIALLALFSMIGCGKLGQSGSGARAPQASGNAIELVFAYGSEKEQWIKDVTDAFNQDNHKTASGKPIFVRAVPMGSGECIEKVLSGTEKAHLISPASEAFIKLANAQSRADTGKDLVDQTQSLVLSPVVIAMWKPMAEAIGWGKRPVGWSDILALTRKPNGWASCGHSEWGAFRFGHTHPEYSNSGLISIMAEVYAARHKTGGLTLADISNPATGQFISDIEKSVVHYGSSTGFFGKSMFANGPQYLSAAVLYENMVIESTQSAASLPFPVVAIYPKEGTFWSDHPVGVVQREWVTPEHKQAAKAYIDFLLAHPQQQKAMSYGFRPADTTIALASPLDVQHGVNPKEPKTTLEVPSAQMIHAIMEVWAKHKKHSNIVLLLDTSGSMADAGKLVHAKSGATELINVLSGEDYLSLIPFGEQIDWAARNKPVKSSRAQINGSIGGLFAQGGTRLYDAIDVAFQQLQSERGQGKISAIVVLSDGADTRSQMSLEMLLSRIRSDNETRNVRIFAIGYGSEASRDVLGQIADSTHGKFYAGDTSNIRDIFRDISTFF